MMLPSRSKNLNIAIQKSGQTLPSSNVIANEALLILHSWLWGRLTGCLPVQLWSAFLSLCPGKSLMEPFLTVAELPHAFEVHQTAKVRSR